MTEYVWKALTAEGRSVKGKTHAEDMADLVEQLTQSELLLITAKRKRSPFLLRQQKLTRESLMTFTLQLSMMLRAGVSILDALRDIAQAQAHTQMRQIIESLVDALKQGKTLSQAMVSHPKIFDEIYINLVHAGEQTGQLIEVLENLTETLKWQHEVSAQTKKALVYPCIVLCVISAVLLFMLGYVVPEITKLLKIMQIPLPWPTKVVIFISDGLRHHWLLIGAGLALIVTCLLMLAKAPPFLRAWIDRAQLKLPLLGAVLHRIALARFSYVLAMLYAAGITVTDALQVVEKAVGNQAMASSIRSCRMQIGKGKSLSVAFSTSDLFPPMVISMLRVGEATGSLDKALKNVSYLYTRESRDAIEKLETSLQPLMTVVLGLTLALIMVFTLGPLYDSVIGGVKF